jgi:hypothetical protein
MPETPSNLQLFFLIHQIIFMEIRLGFSADDPVTPVIKRAFRKIILLEIFN